MATVIQRSIKTSIGVRELREITIWPLSMADEIAFSEKIIGLVEGYETVARPQLPVPKADMALEDYAESLSSEDTNAAIAAYIVTAIKDNLLVLLKYVTDDKITLKDLTNEQFADICDIIYEMNFAGTVGKFKSLLKKAKALFPSQQKTPFPNSSLQPATDMNTSSDSDLETEE